MFADVGQFFAVFELLAGAAWNWDGNRLTVQLLANGKKELEECVPKVKLALMGPIDPKNPGSMMRLFPGTCYTTHEVAGPGYYQEDVDWLQVKIDEIAAKEAKEGK